MNLKKTFNIIAIITDLITIGYFIKDLNKLNRQIMPNDIFTNYFFVIFIFITLTILVLNVYWFVKRTKQIIYDHSVRIKLINAILMENVNVQIPLDKINDYLTPNDIKYLGIKAKDIKNILPNNTAIDLYKLIMSYE